MMSRIKSFVAGKIAKRSPISMWRRRAKTYGQRAVLNLGHTDDEIEAVTQMQVDCIFPHLKESLLGTERTILDLGCGTGRFTAKLAELIQGKAVGVDPVQQFLDIAPKTDEVEYRLMKGTKIPCADHSVDIVWICLVLGGIIENVELKKLIADVNRILKNGGLLCVVENTSKKKDGQYWKFRSVVEYKDLFQYATLRHCIDYIDLGEDISVMVGRKDRHS
ncbi:MAG: class I SAM-dependent methyltransferase [Bacteroidia bacterium]|nr:class I SAM-dependent methyltransferase [Bacteroidia bacterium]